MPNLRTHCLTALTALILATPLSVAACPEEPPLLPLPATPSNHGPSFQIVCRIGQRSHNDPIVFPSQPSAAHEHQFFGARDTNAFSTYDDLSGSSTTCDESGDSAAYWVSTLYDADGERRDPRRVRAYYYAHTRDRDALEEQSSPCFRVCHFTHPCATDNAHCYAVFLP